MAQTAKLIGLMAEVRNSAALLMCSGKIGHEKGPAVYTRGQDINALR